MLSLILSVGQKSERFLTDFWILQSVQRSSNPYFFRRSHAGFKITSSIFFMFIYTLVGLFRKSMNSWK